MNKNFFLYLFLIFIGVLLKILLFTKSKAEKPPEEKIILQPPKLTIMPISLNFNTQILIPTHQNESRTTASNPVVHFNLRIVSKEQFSTLSSKNKLPQ